MPIEKGKEVVASEVINAISNYANYAGGVSNTAALIGPASHGSGFAGSTHYDLYYGDFYVAFLVIGQAVDLSALYYIRPPQNPLPATQGGQRTYFYIYNSKNLELTNLIANVGFTTLASTEGIISFNLQPLAIRLDPGTYGIVCCSNAPDTFDWSVPASFIISNNRIVSSSVQGGGQSDLTGYYSLSPLPFDLANPPALFPSNQRLLQDASPLVTLAGSWV